MISGTRTKKRAGPVIAFLLLCLAACGKKEETPSHRPALTTPEPAFSSSTSGAVPAKAEAQVTSTKGPIQLTLRLYKTKIKKEQFSNFWYQLELKNVGKDPIFITDKLFSDPQYMWQASQARFGVYIEVTEPEGQLMDVKLGNLDGVVTRRPLPAEDQQEVEAAVAKWKSLGLSLQQINIKLLDLETTSMKQSRLHPKPQGTTLEPGMTIATPPWLSPDSRLMGKSLIASFAELDAYLFYRPGKFKIRAIYVDGLRQEAMKKLPKSPDDYYTSVKTPSMEIEVLP